MRGQPPILLESLEIRLRGTLHSLSKHTVHYLFEHKHLVRVETGTYSLIALCHHLLRPCALPATAIAPPPGSSLAGVKAPLAPEHRPLSRTFASRNFG